MLETQCGKNQNITQGTAQVGQQRILGLFGPPPPPLSVKSVIEDPLPDMRSRKDNLLFVILIFFSSFFLPKITKDRYFGTKI